MEKNILIEAEDWQDSTKWRCNECSNLNIEELLINLDVRKGNLYNLGVSTIHSGVLQTQGYIGLVRMKNSFGKVIKYEGRECVLHVKPRFNIDPVQALIYIANNDEEYESYLKSLGNKSNEAEDKWLFKFFEDETPIKITGKKSDNNMLIIAIAYVGLLKDLCRRNLKPSMNSSDSNLTGKVKGKIIFSQHIKHNILKGREDRIYCRHQVITFDNIENQILQEALYVAEKLIKENKLIDNLKPQIAYCKHILRFVPRKRIKVSDYTKVKVNGMYSYYKPVINMAKMLLANIAVNINDNVEMNEVAYVQPYMINMETIFELFTRTIFKKAITAYKESMSNNLIPLQLSRFRTIKDNDNYKILKGKYDNGKLISTYIMDRTIIPDLVIEKGSKNEGIEYIIFDCKYKDKERRDASRYDAFQLMTYSLLYNAKIVGFVFPSFRNNITKSNNLVSLGDRINIVNERDEREYYEYVLTGNSVEDYISNAKVFLEHILTKSKE